MDSDSVDNVMYVKQPLALGHGHLHDKNGPMPAFQSAKKTGVLGHSNGELESANAACAPSSYRKLGKQCKYYVPPPRLCDEQTGAVVVTKGTFDLTFVESVMEIDTGPTYKTETVDAYKMTNDVGIEVTVIERGGTLLQIKKNGKEYLWKNPNAAYYGQNTNSFALTRGIVLHGGTRFTCVAPEHGIYFDSDWQMDWKANDSRGASKSIVLWIQDTAEQRALLHNPGSTGLFARSDDATHGLSKYPVTNLVYRFTITLNAKEEYVHLTFGVENPSDEPATAEAWLPMMLPAERDSQIITAQKMMWRRDEWCFPGQPNMIDYAHDPLIKYPLHWNTMGIYYTWPKLDGFYHGCNVPSTGQGTIFVTDPTQPTFMKLWSWGDRKTFVRDPSRSDCGRPHTDYYECWASGTSPAFFETSVFPPHRNVDFNCALLPIEGGLDAGLDNQQLQRVVETAIKKAGIAVSNAPTPNLCSDAK